MIIIIIIVIYKHLFAGVDHILISLEGTACSININLIKYSLANSGSSLFNEMIDTDIYTQTYTHSPHHSETCWRTLI